MPEKLIDADEIRHELERLGYAWADTHAAASALEETEKSALAKATNEARAWAKSHAEAEAWARDSANYREHIENMVEARRIANRARVSYDSLRAWIELKRTSAATDRALMTLR